MITRTMTRSSLVALVGAFVAACGGSDSAGIGGSTGTAPAGTGGTTTTTTGTSTGTGATAGPGGAATGGNGGASVGCQGDSDCKEADKPHCDVQSGKCVGCLSQDQCPTGQFCDSTTQACQVGCDDPSDCSGGNSLVCNPMTHQCVGCFVDTDCPAGSICPSGSCIPGCSGTQACQSGFSCCGSVCYDLANDEEHCGMCDTGCAAYPNAAPICNGAAP